MKRLLQFGMLATALASGVVVPPTPLESAAVASPSPSYQLLQAVRNRDGNKATELLDGDPGLVNTRDVDTGETPLIIAIARRDTTWVRFLLGRRADVNTADRSGTTPLMAAAQAGATDALALLISLGARVNQDNSRGETALHYAVQRRDATLVRALVDAGANPDVQDSIAGMSPRDYARRDSRGAALLAAMEPRAPVTASPVIIAQPAGPQ